MKTREFVAMPSDEEKSRRTLKVSGKTGKVSYGIISPRQMRKRIKSTGKQPKIRGFVQRRNNSRTVGALQLQNGSETLYTDVYRKKPFFSDCYGYIKVGENEYMSVVVNRGPLLIILLLAAAILAATLFLRIADKQIVPVSPLPEQETETATVETVDDNRLTVSVILPEGETTIAGTVLQPGDESESAVYTGEATLLVTQPDGDATHTLLNTALTVTDGTFADTAVDFTTLDYELVPGVYTGTAQITFPDGTTEERDADIIIREKMGGTVEVMYSNEVYVDKESGSISLQYTQNNSSHNTKIQIVLVDESEEYEEYILAESDVLQSGTTVETLPLDKSMAKKLQTGTYNGILRVFMLGEETQAADINSDIEATIIVE